MMIGSERLHQIRIYIGITVPGLGLYYTAICPHGISNMYFDPVAVEALTGVEKVRRLATAQRAMTGCVCQADDEESHGPTDPA